MYKGQALSRSHVRELKDAFVKGGLERGAPENYITVLYSTKEVRRIWESQRQQYEGGGHSRPALAPRPPGTQLVSVALDAVEPSAHDRASPVNYKLVEALRLGGEKSFPMRRLITRTREAVKAAFYTGDGSDGSYCRTTGLLKTMDDAAYRKVYRAIWTAPDLALVDLKHLLHSKRSEIETAVRTTLDGLYSSRGSTDKYPGDTPVRKNDTTLIALQQSIEKTVALSSADLRTALLGHSIIVHNDDNVDDDSGSGTTLPGQR
ncbi:hypothetical protein CMUS01_13424 [Colletotrichum musicola]|uniref:Uncharacterized protein n=1 Tax=Colletotrichum musicola TaxID=2175873 RepID=A0A8H6MVJ2_9PEZI|nr:hypothetical protein CMUS01_13424 [Colletotrichum musicola]